MRESSFYLSVFLKIFSCMPQKLAKILSSPPYHHKTNTNSIVIMRAVNAPYTFSKTSTSNTPSRRRASSSLRLPLRYRLDLSLSAAYLFSRWCDSFANGLEQEWEKRWKNAKMA